MRGDLHDIGKNLVAMMLEGAGFEIDDLGTDVSPEKVVNAIVEQFRDIHTGGAARVCLAPARLGKRPRDSKPQTDIFILTSVARNT